MIRRKPWKRSLMSFLALLLAVVMTFSTAAYAAENDLAGDAAAEEIVVENEASEPEAAVDEAAPEEAAPADDAAAEDPADDAAAEDPADDAAAEDPADDAAAEEPSDDAAAEDPTDDAAAEDPADDAAAEEPADDAAAEEPEAAPEAAEDPVPAQAEQEDPEEAAPAAAEGSYTLKLDANGGTVVEGSSYAYLFTEGEIVSEGNTYYYLPDEYDEAVTRDGYKLIGWTEDSEGDGTVYTYSYTPESDITLYAKWERCYTVKFDIGDGKVQNEWYIQDRTVTQGDDIYLYSGDDVATMKGYKLAGWTEKKGGKDILSRWYIPTKDITLYAVWNKAYTIKLNLNGGKWANGDTSRSVTWCEGEEYISLPEYGSATNGKKALAGWSTTKKGEKIETYGFSTTKNMTLYAVWKPEYKITYNKNGGKWTDSGKSSYSSGKKWYEGSYLNLPDEGDITRSGYSLAGWSTKKDGSGLISRWDFFATKDTTIYAVWKKECTITYNVNGGSWTYSNPTKKETVLKGESIYLPSGSQLTKKNSVLIGWSEKQSGGTVYSCDETYKVTKSVKLYARYAKAYKITLNANGGKFGEGASKTIMVQKGKETSLPIYGDVVSKKGYVLAGWTEKKNKGTVLSGFYTPKKNITLYAKWAKKITITFNAGDGVFPGNVHKVTIETGAGMPVGSIYDTPTLKNRVFQGWYTDSKCTKPLKKSASFKKNTTVYAKWQKKPLKVTVCNLKGASYNNRRLNEYVDNSTVDSYYFYIDKGDTLGNIYAYKSGIQARFYLDKNFKTPYYSSYCPTKDIKVYAKWNDRVTVMWDGNGGGQTGYYGNGMLRIMGTESSYTTLMCEELPDATEMRRTGYVFEGWYLAKDSKKKVLPASHVFTKNTVVMAKWSKALKVTINLNGGTMSNSYYSDRLLPCFYVKSGKQISTAASYIPEPTKEGYVFKGWKSSVTKKVVKSLYGETIKKATTYTAQWSKPSKTVTVTLVAGYGSIWDYENQKYAATVKVKVGKNLTYSEAYGQLRTPTYDESSKHMYFAGWSLKKQNGKAISGDYKFTKNVKLYPIWKKRDPRVALVTNGGSYYNSPQNSPVIYQVAKNGKITLPTKKEMEREGYTFQGWYSDSSLKTKLSNQKTYTVKKDGIFLYAKWKKK